MTFEFGNVIKLRYGQYFVPECNDYILNCLIYSKLQSLREEYLFEGGRIYKVSRYTNLFFEITRPTKKFLGMSQNYISHKSDVVTSQCHWWHMGLKSMTLMSVFRSGTYRIYQYIQFLAYIDPKRNESIIF